MFDLIEADGGGAGRKLGFAYLSIVVGLLSVFLHPLSGLLALAGLALGCYVLVKANGEPSIYSSGSAKLLILGSVIAFLVFTAIAAPSVLTANSARNETSAVKSMAFWKRSEHSAYESRATTLRLSRSHQLRCILRNRPEIILYG